MIYLDYPSEKAVIDWNGKGFKKMTNLKTLVIKNGNFSNGSRYFPSSLIVLEWEKYPSTPFCIMKKASEFSFIMYIVNLALDYRFYLYLFLFLFLCRNL
jgi:hypothetical protein